MRGSSSALIFVLYSILILAGCKAPIEALADVEATYMDGHGVLVGWKGGDYDGPSTVTFVPENDRDDAAKRSIEPEEVSAGMRYAVISMDRLKIGRYKIAVSQEGVDRHKNRLHRVSDAPVEISLPKPTVSFPKSDDFKVSPLGLCSGVIVQGPIVQEGVEEDLKVIGRVLGSIFLGPTIPMGHEEAAYGMQSLRNALISVKDAELPSELSPRAVLVIELRHVNGLFPRLGVRLVDFADPKFDERYRGECWYTRPLVYEDFVPDSGEP